MQADTGVQRLKEKVDTLIVIPNDRLLTVANEKTSVLNAFKMADEVLLQGVSGITNLITTPGLINTDFADVKMVLSNAGSALMGIGQASGDDRAVSAAKAAISSPLLESAIDGARGVLLNITGPSSMGLFEMNAAAEIIHGVAHQDANIIFGTVIDDEMGDEVKVTVIAAGFDRLDGAGLGAASASAASRRRDHRAVRRATRPIRSIPTTTTTSTSRRSCKLTQAVDRRARRRSLGRDVSAGGASATPSPPPAAGAVDVVLRRDKGFGPDGRAAAAAPPAARRSARTTPRSSLGKRARSGGSGRACTSSASCRPTRCVSSPASSTSGRRVDRPRIVAEIAKRAPGAARADAGRTPPASRARAAARSPSVAALVGPRADAGLVRRRADDGRPDRRRPGGRRGRRSRGRARARRRLGLRDVLDGDERRPRGRRRGRLHPGPRSAASCFGPRSPAHRNVAACVAASARPVRSCPRWTAFGVA